VRAEPPKRRVAESPSRRAPEPPSRLVAELPNHRAGELTSRRAAESHCRAATENCRRAADASPSSRAAEPPGRQAAKRAAPPSRRTYNRSMPQERCQKTPTSDHDNEDGRRSSSTSTSRACAYVPLFDIRPSARQSDLATQHVRTTRAPFPNRRARVTGQRRDIDTQKKTRGNARPRSTASAIELVSRDQGRCVHRACLA